jgi:hypothetical protein
MIVEIEGGVDVRRAGICIIDNDKGRKQENRNPAITIRNWHKIKCGL